jgi:hypothetical protein
MMKKFEVGDMIVHDDPTEREEFFIAMIIKRTQKGYVVLVKYFRSNCFVTQEKSHDVLVRWFDTSLFKGCNAFVVRHDA